MTIRAFGLAFLLLALPATAGAQANAGGKTFVVTMDKVPTPPAATVAAEDMVKVELVTAKGRIVLALDRGRAPVTAKNFLRYVEAGRFDGQSFYRSMPYGEGGLVQGGIVDDASKLFPPIAHEPTNRTGLRHRRGTVSMGRLEPGTARADFFILLGDIEGLDASDEPGMDKDGFAAFGHVVEGMDVVAAIFAGARDPDRGEGAMKGQMLAQPVKIVKARKLD